MKKICAEILFLLYGLLWTVLIPFLKKHKRIGEGFDERRLKNFFPEKKDIWFQAASAGESYLVETLLENYNGKKSLNILITTCTSQGVEILEKAVAKTKSDNIQTEIRYLPFDKPSLMKRAVKGYNPDVMVLLETEIWPGLLRALKKNGTRTLIINGRITKNSVNGYKKVAFLWPLLAPSKILATKKEDAKHFRQLFKTESDLMNNIKFDRIPLIKEGEDNPLSDIVSDDFLVLGSVRQEEEEKVAYIIKEVLKRRPETVIGLFPRHMHRIDVWKEILTGNGLKFKLRTELTKADSGEIILWDRFGELAHAYSTARAVFVGGSLEDLGGQNFLEPLLTGVVPTTGPYWDNFFWLGEEIVELVNILPDEKSVTEKLVSSLENPEPKDKVKLRAFEYLKEKRGGTEKAWGNILQ